MLGAFTQFDEGFVESVVEPDTYFVDREHVRAKIIVEKQKQQEQSA